MGKKQSWQWSQEGLPLDPNSLSPRQVEVAEMPHRKTALQVTKLFFGLVAPSLRDALRFYVGHVNELFMDQ